LDLLSFQQMKVRSKKHLLSKLNTRGFYSITPSPIGSCSVIFHY